MRRLIVFLCAAIYPAVAIAAELVGPPVVLDGDTIEVAGRVVHLTGIDAPEFGQRCRRGDTVVDCGMIARTMLLDLTAGSEVWCVVNDPASRPGWPDVGLCRGGGYDLSEGMVHTGWALPIADAPARYQNVAAEAKSAGRGLWGFAFVAPPQWRAGARLAEVDSTE